MLDEIMNLPEWLSKVRIYTILDTLLLRWDCYSFSEKSEILQVLANDKIHFQSGAIEMFTSNLLAKAKSKEEFEMLICLNPGAISRLDHTEILILLREFGAPSLILYLDVNDISSLQWIESNILLVTVSEIDILKFTRIWVIAAMYILKQGNIEFFYKALQHNILGPLLIESVPTTALQYMKSADLPEATIAVFESLLLNPRDSFKSYSEYALRYSKSEPLIYLVNSLNVSLTEQDLPSKIKQAVQLSKTYHDNIYTNILQCNLIHLFAKNTNLQFQKSTLATILKLPSPDLSLNIKAILHAEMDTGVNHIRELLAQRKKINGATFLDAYKHFKGIEASLTFEFLKYAMAFAHQNLIWSRIVLFCTLGSLSDPFIQLLLNAKVKEEIKNTAEYVNDERARLVLRYL